MIKKIRNSSRLRLLIRNIANSVYITQDVLILLFLHTKSFFNKIQFKDTEFKIVTASDTSHFKSAKQLISSIQKYNNNARIVFYDLGLQKIEIEELEKLDIIYKKFDFDAYPNFFKLTEPDAGAYAWKPHIIFNEMNNFSGNLIWMDAGNVIFKPIYKLLFLLTNIGFYSPLSNGYVRQWTHQSTLDSMNVEKFIYRKRMLNAAIIGINTENKKYKNFITNWKNLAIQKNFILPEGAGKPNHRWDQSLLTVSYYKEIGKIIFLRTHKYFGILTHQDVD